MPKRTLIVVLLLLLLTVTQALAVETITFSSLDGLEITADLYAPHASKATPFIVLFHQAGWSRGEYQELAPWLNKQGFNCLAVDQRSGHEVNGVVNATAQRAKKADKGTTYLDAQQDLIAALKYAHSELATGKILAWGSSYSAALVLVVAGDHPDLVDGVLAFSPGEYFAKFGKSPDWVARVAARIKSPVFITSARSERDAWKPIYAAVTTPKASYIPNTMGNHGSRALWSKFDDHKGYRGAVMEFLKTFITGSGKP